jgi:hypothetical protein
MTGLLAAALLVAAPAMAYDPHPFDLPKGVVVPPYERPVERPLMESALIIRGEVLSVHRQISVEAGDLIAEWVQGDGGGWVDSGRREDLPYTDAYRAYTAERFAGYPDPLWAGRWGFEMLRIRVDAVIAAEHGVNVKPGDVIDLYITGNEASFSNQVVVFAERYVRASEGTVSPWSEADKAFMVPGEHLLNGALISEATSPKRCRGAALASSSYVLALPATLEDLHAIATRVGGEVRGDRNVANRFGGGIVGEAATTSLFSFDESPWDCPDLMTLDEVEKSVREARR